MSSNVIGSFYFRKTFNGNLLGEFSNIHLGKIITESANIITISEGFVGTYESTWYEHKEANALKLSIDYKDDSNNQILELKWSDGTSIIYWGEGFVNDNVLLGHYRNFEHKIEKSK
ncbi:MAG: hypothetical protein WC756_04985 [Taibaiella sp.]|jgi:hypothetical protein